MLALKGGAGHPSGLHDGAGEAAALLQQGETRLGEGGGGLLGSASRPSGWHTLKTKDFFRRSSEANIAASLTVNKLVSATSPQACCREGCSCKPLGVLRTCVDVSW